MTYPAQDCMSMDAGGGGADTAARPTVFVVDDYDVIRDSLIWLIEANGLAVEVFASAEGFLAGYRPGQPGCLVLDVKMPGMGGMALLDEMRDRGFRLPVILMSGSRPPEIISRAQRAGVLDFLEKPFSDQALMRRIRQAIALDQRTRRAEAGGKGEG